MQGKARAMNGPTDNTGNGSEGKAPFPVNVLSIGALDHKRRECRSLYWRGWSLRQIHDETGVNYDTLASWKRRGKWDAASPVTIVEDRIEAKIATFLDKPNFDEGDMKRVDFLTRQMERMARIKKYSGEGGRETDLNPNIEARNSPDVIKKKEAKRNQLTAEQIEQCRDLFEKELFDHQRQWWQASGEVIRFILKSRQIGATWYFAREAFMRGMDTGNNQIFLSASRNQAEVFKTYIQDFVYLATGVELKGKNLVVKRVDEDGNPLSDVTFYFLATNFRTAQSYHGDVYLDECFWVPGFEQFDAVAAAMASHKIYRITYFSTPSTVNHPAYKRWSGALFNEGRPKGQQVIFDVSHRALKKGVRGPDDIWRQIVTLDDAIAGGFDLMDRDALERRNSVEQFANKYGCDFLDDSQSAFPFALIGPCQVDSFHKWRDFSPALINVPGARPVGDIPVLISIDPNNQGQDDAAIAVLTAPGNQKDRFRLLEKLRFTGEDFAGQDRMVREVAVRYNVVDISVDTTGGMGKAVYELIKRWFPMVRRIDYTVTQKTFLVMKGQNVMRHKRFEFDSTQSDVVRAFMAIRPTLTKAGGSVTYTTSRAEGIGHGDIAWAILGAISYEPMNAGENAAGGGFAVFSD